MFEWLSDNRAIIALFMILALIVSFIWSIFVGLKETKLRAKDEVFGDPERTKGGWYWAVCGVSALLLLWFHYSWGTARAVFPNAANELCQIAKIDESMASISAALPIGSRYLKSTTLVVRNGQQVDKLVANMPAGIFSAREEAELDIVLRDMSALMATLSNPDYIDPKAIAELADVERALGDLAYILRQGPNGATPSAAALAQPKWGTSEVEIPILPMTPRGVLFDKISAEVIPITDQFLNIRNISPEAKQLIASTKATIAKLNEPDPSITLDEAGEKTRKAYIKSVDRIFKRLDDGVIFPSASMQGMHEAVADLYDAVGDAKGGLGIVESVFFPGQGIVKSRTQCTEQGPGRWLPKPTDIIATFSQLANPNLETGGGFKGTTLLWWKWLSIADVVAFLIPDGLVDALPGSYGTHGTAGEFKPNYKDKLLAVAQGDVYLGSIPMLDGHIWDSLFRVIVALTLGILLGVPLGIYMGVSRFFKSFFDPLIELYRPVPPLAWAPLILTIFGIQDDGKIFLLFMVAFAIMVISARTGASGTQLSKIRASHSLGATNQQIMRHVILPNAMPEILTGIRIAVGVCWGTLVAAEMLAGTTGLGFIENVARTVADYELIWVTIILLGMLGLLFDIIMRWVISKTIPWRGKG
ncbi:ABC transporter permease [Candidatus Puniceispirillum marinum]|uniref:Probable taurine uptake ABC transporter permease protein n=1 Tax=Puniceispirillum marinum (strain IMCC1322) TaxID=488538 RepID=D5BTT7_PUNMI|nr:ABC transporter permease subunit [Candidatus Puniceispirillum marinum]ADE39684.1 probable taurine uptake ABC transporter permease protein [Candidatus Puniceispirillum marinum IMCC1322]